MLCFNGGRTVYRSPWELHHVDLEADVQRWGRTSASVRSRLSLERLDGRDLPSVTVGDPPVAPPGSQAPPPTSDAAHQAFLATVDAADVVFTTAYEVAKQQFLSVAISAVDQAEAQIQPLQASYQAVMNQQQVVVSAATDAAYIALQVAWQAANGDATAEQQAIDAYNATVQAVTTQANTTMDAALNAIQPAVQTAVDQANANLASAGVVFQSTVQVAMQVYQTNEQLAWDTMLAADGNGSGQSNYATPMGAPQAVRSKVAHRRGNTSSTVRSQIGSGRPFRRSSIKPSSLCLLAMVRSTRKRIQPFGGNGRGRLATPTKSLVRWLVSVTQSTCSSIPQATALSVAVDTSKPLWFTKLRLEFQPKLDPW